MSSRLRQFYLSAIAAVVDRSIVVSTWVFSMTNSGFIRNFRRIIHGSPSISSNPAAETEQFDAAMDETINIHPQTNHSTRAWKMLKVTQEVTKVKPIPRDTPINPKKLRFVCISDTHNRPIPVEDIPNGDVLIHAGDFTMVGHPSQVEEFNTFLGKLPHKHKVVIAGNHDLTFDPSFLKDGNLRRFGMKAEDIVEYMSSKNIGRMADILTNCTTYLEDQETTICGIRIYGSPWQPWFGDWGFNLQRGEQCLEKWNMIPEAIDVLITHGPPIALFYLPPTSRRSGMGDIELDLLPAGVKVK